MRYFIFTTIFLALLSFAPYTHASETNGTIDSSYKYTQICKDESCSTYGTVNWKPTGSTAVSITDSGLSGYAWGDEIGWINLAPTGYGVSVNVTTGALSGYAYSSAGGWVNFAPTGVTPVTIGPTGELSGWAWVSGTNGGWMKFDCASDETCVKTDWRPTSARTTAESPAPSASSGGGGNSNGNQDTDAREGDSSDAPSTPNTLAVGDEVGARAQPSGDTASVPDATSGTQYVQDRISEFYAAIAEDAPAIRKDPNHVESYNTPLALEPYQTGLLVWDFTPSELKKSALKQAVIIEVPRQLSQGRLTLFVDVSPADVANVAGDNTDIIGPIFEITARDADGTLIHSFKQPLKITFIVPEELHARANLGVYSLSEGDTTWKRVEGAVFVERKVSFFVNHLTRFAIHSAAGNPDAVPTDLPPEGRGNAWWVGATIATLGVLWFLYKRRSNKSYLRNYKK